MLERELWGEAEGCTQRKVRSGKEGGTTSGTTPYWDNTVSVRCHTTSYMTLVNVDDVVYDIIMTQGNLELGLPLSR